MNDLTDLDKICLQIIAAFKPRIFVDGNQWCCLYGENIQEGLCAFGTNPMNAVYNFYLAMYAPVPSPK